MSSKIQNRIKIAASPDKVWAVLGDLAAAPTWIPGLTSARVEGMNRVCLTLDGQEIREEISNYSAKKRSYHYKHLQQPLPIKNSEGTFVVEAEGAGSVVVWDAELEAANPAQEAEMMALINGYYRQTLESLKQCVEATSDQRRTV
jgi:mxaD protein